jgi:hypothetical protein
MFVIICSKFTTPEAAYLVLLENIFKNLLSKNALACYNAGVVCGCLLRSRGIGCWQKLQFYFILNPNRGRYLVRHMIVLKRQHIT